MVSSQRRSKAGPRDDRSVASVAGSAIPCIIPTAAGASPRARISPCIWPISSTCSRSMRSAIASSPGDAPRPADHRRELQGLLVVRDHPRGNAASAGAGAVTGASAHPARTRASSTTTSTESRAIVADSA